MLDTLPPRLELASRGPRNVPERQQTLWATIGWSHDLLSDDEREAFAQHAVFAGGWTAEAAAEVCASSPGVTEALLEKNLLLRAGDRLTMLETVREYAVERLDELPDAAAVRRRHAEHMLALVLSGDDVRRTPGEVGWMDRLDLERENLRAAFLFWLDEEPSRAAALAEGSFRFWYARAHFEEGFRAFERLRGRGEALSERQLANVFGRSAAFAFARRDLPLARELVEEALERRRRLDDVDQVARVLVLTGTVRSEQGDHAGALLALEESVELARERGDPFLLNFALAHLLRAAVYAEDYERARAVGDEALRSIRSSGDTGNEFGVLANLGIAALRTRKHREAADRFAAALAVASSLRDPLGMLENIEAIAAVAAAEGLAAPAARLLAGAEALEAARDIRLEAISLAVREDTVAALRVALGEAELREHQRAGGAMALEAAVDEAAALARRLAG
jgi:tetratricopeptide (TPR) repeat protein